jgi:hypothetical protein
VGDLQRPIPVGAFPAKDPQGWEQGVTIGRDGGRIVGRTAEPVDPSKYDEILSNLLPPGFDPAEYSIESDTVQVRSWDAAVGGGQTERFYYFRAEIRRRSATWVGDVDLEQLKRAALKRKPVKPRKLGDGYAMVVHLSDWQIGKGEGGGTPAAVDRIQTGLDAALARAKHEKPASIVLAGLGDLVEGCDGHYPGQTFSVDLDDRDQMKIATRLLLSAIDRFAGWPVTVASCISNHGEKRRGGKAFTGPLDSKDLELLDRVSDVLAVAPDTYGDVRLAGPAEHDPAVTLLDIHGVRTVITHGHVGFDGANASAAAEKWLVGQIKGQRPAADAELILCGHRHHLMCVELGLRRSVVQAPAMDGGSQWFASKTGAQSHPGLLTSLVGDGVGRSGITGLHVHDCS